MASPTPDTAPPVREAATLILVRSPSRNPSILMGRRRRGAVFMPDKFVFPGGAVDAGDSAVPLAGALGPACRDRLAPPGTGPAERFAAAAIRELGEETGLLWGTPGAFAAPGPDWEGFAARGLRPSASGLVFVYRAITPPGRPRRFDARFLLAEAGGIASDPDDFSGASGELSDLAWVPLPALGRLDIAPVTRAVLAFVLPRLPDLGPPDDVPLRTWPGGPAS